MKTAGAVTVLGGGAGGRRQRGGLPLPAVRAAAGALEGRIRATSLGDSVRLKGKQESFEVLAMDEILPEHPDNPPRTP